VGIQLRFCTAEPRAERDEVLAFLAKAEVGDARMTPHCFPPSTIYG
jgi:hypothetical protein